MSVQRVMEQFSQPKNLNFHWLIADDLIFKYFVKKKKIIAQYLFICFQKKIIFIVKQIFSSQSKKKEKSSTRTKKKIGLNWMLIKLVVFDGWQKCRIFIHCFGVANEKCNKSDKVKILFKLEFLLFHILYENFVDFSKNLNRNHTILKDNFIETNIVII